MQKLVTIFLGELGETGDKELKEHLGEYFEEGWSVKMMVPVGAGTGAGGETRDYAYVAGWLAVLLEK